MPESHVLRRDRLRAAVAASGVDAALITTLVNVRYLTGLASSNAALLVPADGPPVLATDSRYALAAERDCPDVQLLTARPVETALAAGGMDLGHVPDPTARAGHVRRGAWSSARHRRTARR